MLNISILVVESFPFEDLAPDELVVLIVNRDHILHICLIDV